jgi:hypothetical protein
MVLSMEVSDFLFIGSRELYAVIAGPLGMEVITQDSVVIPTSRDGFGYCFTPTDTVQSVHKGRLVTVVGNGGNEDTAPSPGPVCRSHGYLESERDCR